MGSTYYKSGSNNVICDRCGYKYKQEELRKTWDGLWVCKKDFELRNAQDFVKGVYDNQSVYLDRPESPDSFIGYCTPDGMSAVVDYAIVDCAIVDFISSLFDPNVNPLPCNAYYVFVNATIPASISTWGCGYLVITDSATLTLSGRIGITNG